MGESGESATQTAVRELREETGIEADASQADVIQNIHNDTGVLRDDVAVVRIDFDSDVQRGAAIAQVPLSGVDVPATGSDWELSQMRWVPDTELKGLVSQGQIVDGPTIAAFAICLLHRPKAD